MAKKNNPGKDAFFAILYMLLHAVICLFIGCALVGGGVEEEVLKVILVILGIIFLIPLIVKFVGSGEKDLVVIGVVIALIGFMIGGEVFTIIGSVLLGIVVVLHAGGDFFYHLGVLHSVRRITKEKGTRITTQNLTRIHSVILADLMLTIVGICLGLSYIITSVNFAQIAGILALIAFALYVVRLVFSCVCKLYTR